METPRGQWERAARDARQRLWAADVACYYAHQRYLRTGDDSHRRIWQEREQESRAAADALREAEQTLGGPGQPGA